MFPFQSRSGTKISSIFKTFSSSPTSSVGNISTPYMQRSFSEGHCPPYTYHSDSFRLRSPVSCSNCVAQHLFVNEILLCALDK